MNIDLIINLRIPQARSVFIVLIMSQQLTSSLHCHFYIPIGATLFDELKEIANNLLELSDQTVTEMLLCGSPNLNGNQNSQILECINPLIFLLKSINNTKKFYSHKKHFSSSCLGLNLQYLH